MIVFAIDSEGVEKAVWIQDFEIISDPNLRRVLQHVFLNQFANMILNKSSESVGKKFFGWKFNWKDTRYKFTVVSAPVIMLPEKYHHIYNAHLYAQQELLEARQTDVSTQPSANGQQSSN